MSRVVAVVAAAVVLGSQTTAPVWAEPDRELNSIDKPTMAVFAPMITASGFQPRAWRLAASRIGEALQAGVIAGLRSSGGQGVLTREQLKQRSAEAGVSPSPTTKAEAVATARALGVDYVLFGKVTRLSAPNRPSVKTVVRYKVSSLIDTSTGEIVWADEVMTTTPGLRSEVTRVGTSRLLEQIARAQRAVTASDEELAALIAW